MVLRIKTLFFLFLMALCFVSCEVEFDPNADWKATTIVYGVLDQDSDTTFVRVQKGFLGNGNYLEFAKERDSIYYKQDEIDVKMISYYPWQPDVICDTFTFNYKEYTSKEEGDFYNENVLIYYCVTKGRLDHEEGLKREYKIIVTNKITNEQTTATTQLIGDYDITSPGHIMSFLHKNGRYIMSCSWYNLNSAVEANHMGIAAKVYQPVIRFYYRANEVETFTDVEFGSLVSTRNNSGYEFKYNMDMDDLVKGLKKNLAQHKGQCSWTNRINAFEFYVRSCSLDMYEYYSNSLQNNSTLSDKPIYTNVVNGCGLFAAKRSYIKRVFDVEDEKLLIAIKGLNYGF